MTKRTHILNELESIAPVLVNTPFGMPYHIPDRYFEQLPLQLLDQLQLDENHDLPSLIVNGSRENVYTVTEDYFENLPHLILDKIYLQEKMAAVPEGYFETLPEVIINKVRNMEVEQELNDVAPLLSTISKKPVQFVPQGYFEELEPELNLEAESNVKIVPIIKRNNWMKYAVAACITGVMAFTAFNFLGKKSDPELVNFPEALARVDDATIENYLTLEGTAPDAQNVAYQAVNDGEIQDFLKEFSDEELQQYLQNEGETVTNN